MMVLDSAGSSAKYYTTDGGSKAKSVDYGSDNKVVFTGNYYSSSTSDTYYMISSFYFDSIASPKM
jgi:hypothetical protein